MEDVEFPIAKSAQNLITSVTSFSRVIKSVADREPSDAELASIFNRGVGVLIDAVRLIKAVWRE